jgi:tetratricopeptide (TPR) repeat protein
MEVQAMKEGRRSRDEALLDALLAKGLEEAGRLEASGRILDGARAYEALARDFGGLRDVTTASQAAARLRATAACAQEAKARERSLQREREYMARAPQALARIAPEEAGTSLGRVLSDLTIADLKKSAGSAKDREERLMARRLLESVFVQTSFYVPRTLVERGDHRRAALSLRVAAEIKPDEPYVWYGLARAQARGGQKSEALKALRRAVRAGFRDAEALRHEPDFDALRKERGYEEILAGLAGRSNETAQPDRGEGR